MWQPDKITARSLGICIGFHTFLLLTARAGLRNISSSGSIWREEGWKEWEDGLLGCWSDGETCFRQTAGAAGQLPRTRRAERSHCLRVLLAPPSQRGEKCPSLGKSYFPWIRSFAHLQVTIFPINTHLVLCLSLAAYFSTYFQRPVHFKRSIKNWYHRGLASLKSPQPKRRDLSLL